MAKGEKGGQGDHFLSPRCILFHELKSFGEAMARRRFYRWNFVFSEKTFEESFRDSASRSQWDGMNGWSTGEGRIKRRAQGGYAHFKRESRRENGEESTARAREEIDERWEKCAPKFI